ncbi:MAG TPA: phosphonate ABC transporter ATP-binding protein [Mycobacteriales bacterium]|nr:phosphonate ABC transporter ATP-binding protein [Mycobacteriales bacterium]
MHVGIVKPVIEFDRVTKRFGSVTALDEVSLTVRPGERVALLGRSGSGKSTLLRHVDGLQTPTEGVADVLDTDLGAARGARLRALRRQVGFIFQQFELVGSRTVLENVCTGALGRLRGPRLGLLSYPKSVRAEALGELDRVGLADRAFQRADTLSGGQQQRVAIARALLQRPRILLADEPVASLDPESSTQIMRLLADICADEQLTVLCSLHQVDLALSWAERVVGLREGRVVLDRSGADIRHADVMSIYSAVGVAAPTLAVAG